MVETFNNTMRTFIYMVNTFHNTVTMFIYTVKTFHNLVKLFNNTMPIAISNKNNMTLNMVSNYMISQLRMPAILILSSRG